MVGGCCSSLLDLDTNVASCDSATSGAVNDALEPFVSIQIQQKPGTYGS